MAIFEYSRTEIFKRAGRRNRVGRSHTGVAVDAARALRHFTVDRNLLERREQLADHGGVLTPVPVPN